MIKNALKFTKQGSIKVKVSYERLQNLLIVHVKDTGIGIAKEDFPKLFNRFGKLHRTAHLNHEGIGLGLTIVKQIVEACKGTVSFNSRGLGHGSTFCFSMKFEAYETEVNSPLLVPEVPKRHKSNKTIQPFLPDKSSDADISLESIKVFVQQDISGLNPSQINQIDNSQMEYENERQDQCLSSSLLSEHTAN